ncbi:hypothetical protein BDY21DRAFT_358821 [Lineolata rhizophorae]|uniref:Uncharacterized protein n=1 Tax=Lineolata rhizophorae TaxID=578093 RepID=A0A6A6NLI4_9PEZI|nr:hypothetical protein BDY21DRAFT_358821 [Lineolata rhizophorae]
MKQELRHKLPDVLLEQGFHRSASISMYVRKVERRLSPEGRSANDREEDSSECSETASVATGARAPSNEPQALPSSDLTPLQPVATSATLQPQGHDGERETDRCPELTGSVYELTPVDILELATGLIAKNLGCPGQLLLTEAINEGLYSS